MLALRVLVGLVLGAIAGMAIGFFGIIGIAYYEQWMHPQDPSAGSIAILVIVTVPIGLMIGTPIGAIIAVRLMPPRKHNTRSPKAPILRAELSAKDETGIAFTIIAEREIIPSTLGRTTSP